MRKMFFSACFFMMVGAFSLEHMVSSAGGIASQLSGAVGASQTQQAMSGLNGGQEAGSSAVPEQESAPAQDPAKIIQDYQAELEKMTPEEREFFKNSSPGMQTLTNPIVRKLMGSGPAKKGGASASDSSGMEGVASVAAKLAAVGAKPKAPSVMKIWAARIYMDYYPRYKDAVFTGSWIVPLSLLVLSAVCMVLQYGGASSFLCNIVLEGSGFVLALFSALCVYVGLYFGGSVALSMLMELLPSPIVFLVLSAGLMRLLDMNFPVMSQVVGSLVMPVLCAVVAGGLSLLSGTFPKII